MPFGDALYVQSYRILRRNRKSDYANAVLYTVYGVYEGRRKERCDGDL